MDFNISNLSAISPSKLASNNSRKLNFQGKADIVTFSDIAKERNEILSNLAKLGLSQDKAQEFLQEYYKTPKYYDLINGIKDEPDEAPFPAHYVEIERNLTPTEAIVYLAYDMDPYYVQHGDWDFPDIPTTTFAAQDYDLGKANFLPMDLAKNIDEDIDIVLSGMILKGIIDKEEAKKIAKYYNISQDNFSNSKNLKEAEYTAYLIGQNLDELDYLISTKKDEDGNLVNGFSRPLTDEEALALITNKMPRDKASINNYIAYNNEFKFSLFDMTLKELWEKTPEEYKAELKTRKVPAKIKIECFEDAINAVKQRIGDRKADFFDDISMLDSEKFYGRYPASAIQYDALMDFGLYRELRQKNIQILNDTSEELLNKMTSGQRDKKGRFALLKKLFEVEDLDERISVLERYKDENPIMFDALTKASVMDYLTNSDFYSNHNTSYQQFLDILSGKGIKDNVPAKIIKFPSK